MTKKRGSVRQMYFSVVQLAELLDMTTIAARKWIQRNKAGRKIGGRWFATRSQLAAAFPEAFQELAR